MASTSSSTGNASTGKFDVFINHHGKDVKNTLASAIYHRLESIGVRAFLDKYELEAGEEFPNAINEAVRSASLHIAIFSPNYARSWWCLHELTLMLQTGNKIIPIFYLVEPCDVRHIRGDYSKAFSEHERKGRYKPQELEQWKEALSKVSKVYGYEVKQRENDDGLLEKIVESVEKEMKKLPLLHVATHPVGLGEALQEFQNKVECGSQCTVKIVGIWGPGGSGKTTLASEYFNQKRSSYKKSSFLSEVRDAAAKNKLHDLQKQLLQDLVHDKLEINDRSAGKGTLERRVPPMKSLIVLDDVDDIDQIEYLLPLKGNLQPGSLVIVTTRDSAVITSSASLSSSVSVSLYKKRGLDPVHAKQLFCQHAFLRDSPEKGFDDLVEKFLKACQGLPLYLKVVGAQLYGNTITEYWDSVLRKISNILPDKIKEILEVSYNALDEEQQQMFMDVACFFIGEPKDMVISIWDGSSSDGFLWSGCHGFQVLVNKCLVEVDNMSRIRMHDHLRDLGRDIANKKRPSRFRSHSQFVNSQRPLEEILPIRGIMAYSPRIMRGIMNYQPLFEERMQLLMGHSTSRSRTPPALGLQLLVVGDDYFKEQFAKEELVWLRWYHFPHGKLPSWLSTGKLRVLELYDPERLTELWGPNDSPPSELRELIIKRCNLEMIPQTIGSLKLLKKIVLSSDYFDGAMISSLPEEFCRLESLEHLELTQFSHLSSLPGHFGDLKKLKHLNLYGSKTLTALPMSFNQLTELQYLDLSRCENFQLQEGILESITKLENLRLKGCSKLRELPADIDRLAKLEVLEIESHCLTSLPTALGNLSSLINLKIDSCVKLKNLPSLENLSSLIELTISNCRELTHLPGVGSLTRLEKLRLDDLGVKYLPQGFGQPVNLQTLTIMWCPIRELPLANHMDSSMSKFPRLKDIYLNFTEASTISISEDCCPSLKYLSISNGDDLMEIETLPTTLMRLNIHRCGKLKNIRCVAGLAKLQDLKIFYCAGLEKLPSFAGLVELRNCGIKNCPQLDELPSFACCTCLQELEIEGSNRITKIEGLEELRSLERLRLETYGKWQGIKSLKNLDILAMEISADSRSAIKRFVLPIPKGPRKMHILGKAGAVAVEDVESVVGSLRFSNFTVVYELLNELQHSGDIIRATWQLKSPQSNPSCLIGCFLIPPSPPSCSEDEDVRQLWPVGSSYLFFFNSLHFRGEGKQVYIWVLMERREGDDLMRAFLELQRYGVEMEKGMVVIMSEWEEGRVSEVLHKFMELLEP